MQVVTAAILILAANTASQDFPRLSSVLAHDRFLPRQFLARGDRLVFSNGIVVLTALAIVLLILFQADVSRLIQLYVVGVFTSFTLSQAGMVKHWLNTRGPRWRRSMAINAVGAATTGIVLVIVASTKFAAGAWVAIVAIPVAVLAMTWIHRHYQAVSLELLSGLVDSAGAPKPRPHHVLIFEDRVDGATAAAVSYAKHLAPTTLRALLVADGTPGLPDQWRELAADVPATVLDPDSGAVEAFTASAGAYAAEHADSFTTAIVPEGRSRSWLDLARRHGRAQRVKASLVGEGRLAVANVVASGDGPEPYEVVEPVAHHVVVLASGVHMGTLRALAYAKGLNATSVRALSINLETEGSTRLLGAWDDWGIDVPLELVDSPFHSITDTLRTYVRDFGPDGRHTVVTCLLPEFVLQHWWQRPLHNQTALLIKSILLFEPGVVTVSIPYQLSGHL